MILLGWNIWLGCQLLLGEYCQLIEDEGECSNFFVSSIDGLQVWKEDKCVKVFELFVLMIWNIQNLEY